jgi:large subunit ribosomal protein L13
MRLFLRPRSGILLLSHRGHIPPFSSYGGILRGSQGRAFFGGMGRKEFAPGVPAVLLRRLTTCRQRIIIQDFAKFDRTGPFSMKTYSAKPQDITRDWYVIDANDKVLGRLASGIAHRLRGKHKPIYTPHIDTGDFIVVTNVDKIKVTGNKQDDKLYHRHSGYPGGVRTTSFSKMQQRFPGRALQKAVKGMLPKGPLGYAMLKKLKCYAGAEHPHSAQQPKTLDF